MPRLPRTVIALGVVSFFTDFSSEMIYPLLPLFLSSVLGAGAFALGLIEGVAESTASLVKIASGIWTDRVKRRKPFLVAGYGLAGAVRPLIGLAQVWPLVLLFRFADRVGKGLRSSPRDALIADVTVSEQRGAAYGLHRAMDHAGAVAGPLMAALLMSAAGFSIRTVFLCAAIPAAVVMIVLLFAVKDPPRSHEPVVSEVKTANPVKASWNDLGGGFKWYLATLLLFTLGNSTDAFLLLRLSDAGVPAVWTATLWALHHVVKMLATYYGGRFSDRIGYRRMIVWGWLVYAAVYAGFAAAGSAAGLIAVFLAYGIYFGLTEPAEKALVSRLAPASARGSAFGYYHGVIGLGALPASLLFGLIWKLWGAPVAFITGAGLALAAALLLTSIRLNEN